MKPKYDNRTMTPPEDKPSKSELDQDGFEQSALKYVQALYKVDEVYDLYEHDREVAINFADWSCYNYTRQTDGTWRKRGGGWNKKAAKGISIWTTKTLWEIYCKQNNQQNMKQEFEMNEDEFNEIKSIAQDSTPVMKFGDYWSGMDKQDRANAFWKILANKYGFVWDSAEGISGKGPTHFSATPKSIHESKEFDL